jgi:hypothetical protein
MKLVIKKFPLADYQKRIVYSPKRFTITEGSTKCGKTISHVWWLFEKAHSKQYPAGAHFWWVAPIYNQAKIAFNRMRKKVMRNPAYVINYSSLSIKTPLDTIIEFKTGSDPDSLYGEDVYAAVIDEGSRMKEASFHAVRSTLVATNGEMKLIGNVKGIDNWYYELARKAQAGELANWEYFKFTADDAVRAGILKQEEIDEARAIYPEGVFLELFYAIPFINLTNRFAFAFKTDKHVASTAYNPVYPLYISFDFNRNPICATLFQHYAGRIFGIETIKLANSDIYELCRVIKNKYQKALIIVNGDATGLSSSAMVRDNLNYYKIIRTQLNISVNHLKVPAVNPMIADNQVLVNAILEHYPVSLDPTGCAPLIYDLQFVEMLPDGTIRKGDREDPKQQADALDTFRYYLNQNFKWFLKQWQT